MWFKLLKVRTRPISAVSPTHRAYLGFFRSIALRNQDALQDTLRLLTLWFKYGAHDDVSHAMAGGFSNVEVDTWLEVIPQVKPILSWFCKSFILCQDHCPHPDAAYQYSQKYQQPVDRSWEAPSTGSNIPFDSSIQILQCCASKRSYCNHGADARA